MDADGNPSNTHHLIQMRRCLSRTPEGTEALGRLVNELETLLCQLETSDESWRRRFQSSWAVLEEVFASALDRKAMLLDEDGAELIGSAMAQLVSLLDESHGSAPPGEDR